MSELTQTIDRLSRRVEALEREATGLRRDNRLQRQRLFTASDRIRDLIEAARKAQKVADDLEHRHHRQVGDEVTVLLAKRIENMKFTLMDFVLGRNELEAENKEAEAHKDG